MPKNKNQAAGTEVAFCFGIEFQYSNLVPSNYNA